MSIVGIISVFSVLLNALPTQSSRDLDHLLVKELKVLKKCSDDVGNTSVVIPEELRFDYSNSSSNNLEHLVQVLGAPLFEFSLVRKEPNCKSGTFNVTVFIANNGTNTPDVDEDEIKEQWSFTAEGEVSYRVENSESVKHIIYHKENYCISSITEEEMRLHLCKSQCFAHDEEAGDNACVPRCCPPGKTPSVLNYKVQAGCVSADGTDWVPNIHADGKFTTQVSEDIPQIMVVNDNRVEWNCTKEDQFEWAVLKSDIRILPDGRILWKTKHKWSFEYKEYGAMKSSGWPAELIKEIGSGIEPFLYCADGYQDPLLPHLNDAMIVLKMCFPENAKERDQVLKYDNKRLWVIKLKIFLVHLPSTFTYLIICTIYLSIWDKHHVQGWIILGFSTTLLLNFSFRTVKQALTAFTSDFRPIFSPRNPFCYLIGILHNLRNILEYSWAVVITFDLWKILSSCRPESSQSMGRRIAVYYSFALGIPAFVVFVVAVPMEYSTNGQSEFSPGYQHRCRVKMILPYFLYIIIPNIILYIPNLVFAGLTFRTLRVAKSNAMKMTTSRKKETMRNQAALMIKLLVVMGFSLVFDVAFKIVYFNKDGFVSPFVHLLEGFKLVQAFGLFWTFVCGNRTQEHLREKFPSLFKIFKRSGPTPNNSESERVGSGLTMNSVSNMSEETNC